MKKVAIALLLAIIFSFSTPLAAQAKPSDLVYVISVKGTIDPGLASFVERALREAEAAGATRLLLEIDTFGGRIDAAMRIQKRILSSPIPSISFVQNRAISAGALITLAGEKVVMVPGTTFGAAEPRIGTEKADEKVVSMWAKELAATAETRGRDGKIAAAMADADIEIPGLVEKGKLLTLTDKEALEVNFADFVLAKREDVLRQFDLADAQVVILEPGPAETMARWVTHPYVSPILLTIGFVGLFLEVITVGWGIFGTAGLISLGLFFGGHIIAGLTGLESVLLFAVGVILLLIETFVIPGFGLAGIGGIVALVASIVLASASIEQAIISLLVALVGSVVLIAISFKYVKTRNLWNRLILGVKQNKVEGYIAPVEGLDKLHGEEGITLTPLRPAGAAEIAGLRVDVVTEGGFIPAGIPIKVIKVEGPRVVVKSIKT